MKKIICMVLIMALMGFAAGCGNASDGNTAGTESSSSETAAESTADDAAGTDAADAGSESAGDGAGTESSSADKAETSEAADPSVDIDLTALSSTMVYAQVYDMTTKPDEFIGKTVKVSGPFAVYTDEASGKNYFACIIQDATACCSQGMEFELAGDHSYPDDYPEKGEEITVIGTFDKYEEANATYCTLRKAKMA